MSLGGWGCIEICKLDVAALWPYVFSNWLHLLGGWRGVLSMLFYVWPKRETPNSFLSLSLGDTWETPGRRLGGTWHLAGTLLYTQLVFTTLKPPLPTTTFQHKYHTGSSLQPWWETGWEQKGRQGLLLRRTGHNDKNMLTWPEWPRGRGSGLISLVWWTDHIYNLISLVWWSGWLA